MSLSLPNASSFSLAITLLGMLLTFFPIFLLERPQSYSYTPPPPPPGVCTSCLTFSPFLLRPLSETDTGAPGTTSPTGASAKPLHPILLPDGKQPSPRFFRPPLRLFCFVPVWRMPGFSRSTLYFFFRRFRQRLRSFLDRGFLPRGPHWRSDVFPRTPFMCYSF